MTDPILSNQAAALTESVERLTIAVAEVARRERRSRIALFWTAVGLALDLLLSVGLGFVAIEARKAGDSAEANQSNARVTCESANQSRLAQIQLWTYVLDEVSKAPGRTPEQIKLVRDFRVYISQVFAQRNCDDPAATVRPAPTPGR